MAGAELFNVSKSSTLPLRRRRVMGPHVEATVTASFLGGTDSWTLLSMVVTISFQSIYLSGRSKNTYIRTRLSLRCCSNENKLQHTAGTKRTTTRKQEPRGLLLGNFPPECVRERHAGGRIFTSPEEVGGAFLIIQRPSETRALPPTG